MQQEKENPHSTHLNPDSTPDIKSSLSALGTCCVARYYADDYKLLETIGSALCPSETKTQCQSAINSIIARRQKSLSSDLTCRELTANNSTSTSKTFSAPVDSMIRQPFENKNMRNDKGTTPNVISDSSLGFFITVLIICVLVLFKILPMKLYFNRCSFWRNKVALMKE